VKASVSKLKDTLKLLPNTFFYAFEFRHESWFTSEIYDVLKKYNAALVLSDSPQKNGEYLWPYHDVDTADFYYIRFHGSPQLYYSSYSDEDLRNYADLIKKKIINGQNVYCYFNNDAAGWAVRNAQTLKSLIV
jgi:uncharacterized protein YecE (DUF72 family)